MLTQEDITLIEKLNNNLLTQEEKDLLDKRMNQDIDWGESVKAYLLVLTESKKQVLRSNHDVVGLAIDKAWKNNTGPKPYGIKIPALAILMALMAIGLYWFLQKGRPGHPDIKSENRLDSPINSKKSLIDTFKGMDSTKNYTPELESRDHKNEKLIAYASREINDPFEKVKFRSIEPSDSGANWINQISKYYSKGEYLKGENYLNSVIPQKSNTQDLLLYKAMIAFRIKKYQQSMGYYSKLQIGGQYADDPLEWNILMCRLANGESNTNEFKKLLQKILSDRQHSFYKRAIDLKKLIQ